MGKSLVSCFLTHSVVQHNDRKIQISPKIIVLPSETLSQTTSVENNFCLCRITSTVASVVNTLPPQTTVSSLSHGCVKHHGRDAVWISLR